MARRCWKHSRQKTGRPCVGRKGTVGSLPHCEQLVLVSARIWTGGPPPPPSARFAVHALHRVGSSFQPLSATNICSPAVTTSSAPRSAHFRTLSWYSIEPLPLDPARVRGRELGSVGQNREGSPGTNRAGSLVPVGAKTTLTST